MGWGTNDSRGVSSVVGVLLMVAVTVIIATVVAAFVFDIGSDSTNKSPQISWEYEYNGGDIRATHVSGDEVQGTALSVKGVSGSCANTLSLSGTISSGDSIQIGDGSCASNGVTIRIIWNDPTGEDSAILAEFSN